jgi:hypothetical protein
LRNTAEPERMNRRKALLTAGAAPVALAAIGRARVAATVRIATLTIDSGSACFYAQVQGFFSRAGIDVRIQTIASGGAIVRSRRFEQRAGDRRRGSVRSDSPIAPRTIDDFQRALAG